MYLRNKEHDPPHVHAVTHDFDAPFLIATGELMEGEFPPKAKAPVKGIHFDKSKRASGHVGDRKVQKASSARAGPRRKASEVTKVFHKAEELRFLEGTALEVRFQDGIVKRYDMSVLFDKYPQLKQLNDRALFLSGKLMGAYGIIWNDELDIETETIYQDGWTVAVEELNIHNEAAQAVLSARAAAGLTQKQLAALSGMDQSDISKIERGTANPSVETLKRIAQALGGQLLISIEVSKACAD